MTGRLTLQNNPALDTPSVTALAGRVAPCRTAETAYRSAEPSSVQRHDWGGRNPTTRLTTPAEGRNAP